MTTPAIRPVIWLASYPRSGNTYLRLLLYRALTGDVTGEDSAAVARTIPDAHWSAGRDYIPLYPVRGRLALCKSHSLPGPAHPLWEMTGGMIYIVRDPRDVALSVLRYCHGGATPELLREYIGIGGYGVYAAQGMGAWIDHVCLWSVAAARMPHAIIRYEDLCARPAVALRSLLAFLRIPCPFPGRLREIVRACRRERVSAWADRQLSDRSDPLFRVPPASPGFVGPGASGQSLAPYGAKIARSFAARFGPIATLLGYDLDSPGGA